MGILDDFLTDINSEERKEEETEVREQEKERQGGFDSDYSKSFLEYCKNNSR